MRRSDRSSGAMAVLGEAATDKENSDPQHQVRRQSRDAACKRQAIYGVLFGNRPPASALDKPPALNSNKDHARQVARCASTIPPPPRALACALAFDASVMDGIR